MKCLSTLLVFGSVLSCSVGQVQRSTIDFSQATQDPLTGQLCVMQEVCIADVDALSRLLPAEPCLSEGCTCTSDADCPGPNNSGRCVACNCMQCPVSVGKDVINPPLTFVIDTTRSVKPDKDSIFNLTQRVVNKIEQGNVNIPSYLLVEFNDRGPDITQNVIAYPVTTDVEEFKRSTLNLIFESFDGGRDSIERLMQGVLIACQESPERSLVVVFTDNGSKDLKLKEEILRIKKKKELEIYIVLTPDYEGRPNDDSLRVYHDISEVYNIAEVGADTLISRVQAFETENCL